MHTIISPATACWIHKYYVLHSISNRLKVMIENTIVHVHASIMIITETFTEIWGNEIYTCFSCAITLATDAWKYKNTFVRVSTCTNAHGHYNHDRHFREHFLNLNISLVLPDDQPFATDDWKYENTFARVCTPECAGIIHITATSVASWWTRIYPCLCYTTIYN